MGLSPVGGHLPQRQVLSSSRSAILFVLCTGLMPEIVFEERISLLEVFKHYWLFRFNWREWNRKTMGCKAVCFPRDNLQTFCLEETREYQQWQPEGSLETQEAWAPATKKVGWRAWSKGLAQIACFSTFFSSILLLFISPPPHGDCLNSSTVRTDISIFHFFCY